MKGLLSIARSRLSPARETGWRIQWRASPGDNGGIEGLVSCK
jgi:hypothetical protein